MGELYNPFPRLPKNIRQIGDRDDVVKLYVEDYVNTYLKRLYPTGGQDLRVGILLGSTETYEGVPYIFIDGALEMEDVTAAGEMCIRDRYKLNQQQFQSPAALAVSFMVVPHQRHGGLARSCRA